MNKTAVAAAAVVAMTSLAGMATLPGTAAASDSQVHVLHLVAHARGDVDLGNNRFAATDVYKSDGEVVGYGVGSGRVFRKEKKLTIQGALALKGGIIVARTTQHGLSDTFHFSGPIIGGTGKYEGVKGTVKSHSSATTNDVNFTTIRYHF
jgi:hypothetical protein